MQLEYSPLQSWAQSSPSLLALTTPERDYTWQELATCVNEVVSVLAQQGVVSGQVLTCVGKNSTELLFIYLACLERGAICAMTMPQSEGELAQKLTTLYQEGETAKVWLDEQNSPLAHFHNVTLNKDAAKETAVESAYSENSLASIVFTSGSTGVPKAVAHTVKQHYSSASGLLERFTFTRDDCWLLSLPMYHVSGLAIVHRWLTVGAKLKIGSGILEEDIHHVTHASLVATQLKRLLEQKCEHSLTHVFLGGSHVPLELSREAASQGIETWLGYGMTEAASTVTAKRVDQQYTAGEILPKRKLKLVGNKIYISGETLASGYYCQGKLSTITESGWFDTRDLGEWVGDELKIIGREDNQFISGGENIHCEEVEAALNAIPEIKQSVVIPIKDEDFGQRPVAVVDLTSAINRADIECYLRKSLVKFKWPVAYYLMPKSLCYTGVKLSRAKVKDWLKSTSSTALS